MAVGLDLSIGSSGAGGGGSIATGVLQLASGAALDTTLRAVTDQAGTLSPLQLSTTQVMVDSGSAATELPFRVSVAANTSSGVYIKNRTSNIGLKMMASNGSTAFPYIGSYDSSAVGTYPLTLGVENNTLMAIGATNVGIGLSYPFTTSARLHVRGDGTNPVARFEGSAGTASHVFKDTTALEFGTQGNYIAATANGSTTSTAGRGLLFSGVSGQSIFQFNFVASTNGETSGTYGGINLTTAVGVASGTPNFRPLNIAYTINNSGANTGTATGIYSRATETALNGMLHNLIDLGTTALGSLFSVTNVGAIKVATIADGSAPKSSLYFSSTASRLVWKDAGGTVNNLY